MRVETPKLRAWLIGDPHFGKDFRNGTPLHRRGERERMQRETFLEELNTPDVDVVVMVGDLFDKPFIPLPVLSQVIGDVIAAAQARPAVTFVMMAGNHDRSRQLETEGAWDIFALAVGWLPNVMVVNGTDFIGDMAFFAWDWGSTAIEQVARATATSIHAAVGHWDLKDFGGDTSHTAPTNALVERFGGNVDVYSGHYHEEGLFKVGDIDVICTGSMQPYAHGEGDLYVTLTLDEALAQAEELKDKCVRIVLQPGEVLPELDCLQLSKIRAGDAEEVVISEISLGSFDINQTLTEEFTKNEVPEEVRVFIKERLGDFA